MTFAGFLHALFEEGRVRVGPPEPIDESRLREGDRCLAAYEQCLRLELPGGMPDWEPAAGRWAALQLLLACQFYAYRDIDATAIDAAFAEQSPPDRADPAVVYSVDLTFRFLPDLVRLAATSAQQDPLLRHLHRWCRDWPLSSVGVAPGDELPPPDLAPITRHAPLLVLYVDRIIAREDVSRLDNAAVREAVRAALGERASAVTRIHRALQVPSDVEATA